VCEHLLEAKLTACLRRGLLVAFALAGLLVLPARATTWILTNGDRLTGELIDSDEETLEIKHAQLGRLRLARSAIKSTEAAPEAVAQGTAKPPVAGVTKVVPASAGVVDPIASAPVTPKWKRQVEFGYVAQSGKVSQEDLAFRAQVDGRHNADTYRATAKTIYSESGDKVLSDRSEADFRWRRDFSKRLFSQALTTYLSDSIRDIDLNLEQQLGGGYRILDERRHKANVGLGAVVQYRKFDQVDGQAALLGSVFEDYAYSWSSWLKFTQEANVIMSDKTSFDVYNPSTNSVTQADGNYRLKFNAALQSKITTQISLNLRFDYGYDRTVADPNLRDDQRLTTSLGYAW
jgi:putative salt-induced outer membrane protein YdiY